MILLLRHATYYGQFELHGQSWPLEWIGKCVMGLTIANLEHLIPSFNDGAEKQNIKILLLIDHKGPLNCGHYFIIWAFSPISPRHMFFLLSVLNNKPSHITINHQITYMSPIKERNRIKPGTYLDHLVESCKKSKNN